MQKIKWSLKKYADTPYISSTIHFSDEKQSNEGIWALKKTPGETWERTKKVPKPKIRRAGEGGEQHHSLDHDSAMLTYDLNTEQWRERAQAGAKQEMQRGEGTFTHSLI